MKRTLTTLALLAIVTPALAQPAGPAPTPAPAPAPTPAPAADGAAAQPTPAPPTDDPKAKAKALYEKGLGHYNLGEFELAIAAFKEAYAISNAPGLLFNIAQSYRLKKDYEQASYFYTTYLRLKPDAANRPDVEARLEEMEKLIEEQKKIQNSKPIGTIPPEGQDKKAEAPTTTVTAQTGPTPEGGVPPRKLMMAGIATGGAGAALILTGVIFGSLASSASNELDELNAMGGTWTQEAQDKYDAGKRNNAIAIVTYIAGGAALATGGTLYVLGMMKKKRATVAVTPTAGGKTIAFGWSF